MKSSIASLLAVSFLAGCGGNQVSDNGPSTSRSSDTVRVHILGFQKSKSGAT